MIPVVTRTEALSKHREAVEILQKVTDGPAELVGRMVNLRMAPDKAVEMCIRILKEAVPGAILQQPQYAMALDEIARFAMSRNG